MDKDTIDFNKLERELEAAVEADAKYNRENDAKFRAIHQKVASYDEFRDIVLASHLKPLEKKDKINDMKFQQPWNVHADSTPGGKSASERETNQIKTSEKVPSTSHEFSKNWKRLKTSAEKYDFLSFVGVENLEKIFKIEIAFGLLGEIVTALLLNENSNCEFIFNVLETLSRCGRFQLSVEFLSKKESKTISDLFDRVDKEADIDISRVETVKKKYLN
ncbi:dynein axonemal assembly factor 19-like [Tubulanus polymorphus]|uniref:dynein axonemal assembly factor 19-like n=1 Tax=Tubulanus polymorphus TaxID=672921 RepID=UPI003DA428C8